MAKDLVIVESPAKARTIGAILGNKYTVKASVGHVRDLPKSQIGVDVEKDFAPKYVIPKDKRAVVKDLKEALKGATMVYLATDADREGEAISWHLTQAAEIGRIPIRRVVFHEITQEAIREAFAHPRDIDMRLVNAQQARRILDRLVGYSISPLLWRTVKSGLSAGRVQSVALRMIVDREREIQNFVAREYWSIDAALSKHETASSRRKTKTDRFKATLVGPLDRTGKAGKLDIPDEATVEGLVAALRPAAYTVAEVRRGKTSRQPDPPFTTSTLQQDAFRKLHFSAQRTMAVAQQLYEGLPIAGGAPVGLITYMRTDSVRVADVAVAEAREYIKGRWGADYVPRTARIFRTRTKGAQEAHEAIRPTSIAREPDSLKAFLSPEQFRLYELVWKRMVASQMAAAGYDTITVEIDAAPPAGDARYRLRSSSTQLRFAGFMALYTPSRDDDDDDDEAGKSVLPDLATGEALDLQDLLPEQHFTQPPPRFSDATLIKELEARGIGRPSTYAPILATLHERGYARQVNRHLEPEELGVIVCDLLVEHFPGVVDEKFTAAMEEDLDQIAAGEREWVPVLREFYTPLAAAIAEARTSMQRVRIEPEPAGEDCTVCGKPMVIRTGRFGRFIACSGFPECRNTKPILATIGVACPQCAKPLVERRTKQRRTFYGCSGYPECTFTTWQRPLPEPCPLCGGLLVRSGVDNAKCLKCGAAQSQGRTQGQGETGRVPSPRTRKTVRRRETVAAG